MKKFCFRIIPDLIKIRGTKLMLTMRLTVFALLIGVLQGFAAGTYAQATRLNLSMKNSAIREVLSQIEDQSEFFFLYNSKLVDVERLVNVNVKNKNITEVLDQLFEGTGTTYQVVDRQIVLTSGKMGNPLPPEQPQRGVTGKVTDSKGGPLPGVTLVVKGTTQGTVTSTDGTYSLSNLPGGAVLSFSFVGMHSQEIAVGNQTSIDVVMQEEAIGIEEVVAIGYGTIKKSDLTGAVSTVQGSEITERQTIKVAEALQGAMPGVSVTRSGDAPGANPTVNIRGITTIGNSNPLVIVDGIPGAIDQINPNDVESISVLKDAASASIYGSQAAAGVILITTKRAKTGDLDLSYNFEAGIKKPTQMPDYVGAARNMQIQNEMIWNDNKNLGSEYPVFTKEVIDNHAQLHAENPNKYPDTDWLDFLLNDYAPQQSHLLSLNAGTNRFLSKISVGYDETDALYDGRTYERITVRANNNFTINKFLSVSGDLYYYRAIHKQPYYGVNLSSAPAPLYAAVWTDGRIAQGTAAAGNPYGSLKFGGFNNAWSDVYGGKMALDLTPLKGLKLTAAFAPKIYSGQGKVFRKAVTYTGADSPDIVAGYLEGFNKTTLTEARYNEKGYTSQFLGEYKKILGKHDFTLLLGNENYYDYYESLSAASDNYSLTSYPFLDLGNSNYLTNGGNAYEYAYRSYFGRILYNFNNKYLFQANTRADASSRFAKDYRWGFFPSFSLGWIISEEPFMKGIGEISFMKIRASWGTLGNERIGNYPYQSTVSFGTSVQFNGDNPTAGQMAFLQKYAIEDISWETTETYDVGIDLYAFSNRLRFTGDYYHKNTRDMLLALQIPIYLGVSNPDQNTGKMNTKGWDLELGWNDKSGDFNYGFTFNLSDYKSVMGDLGGTEFLGDQVKKEGSEFNEWYGYKSEGLYLSQEELTGSPVINTSVTVGDIKYKDISGKDGVPDGKISPEYDRVLLGGSLPRYLYGGNINLGYKNFDFLLVFQGVAKRLSLSQQLGLNTRWTYYTYFDGNFWSKYNTDEKNTKVKYPRLTYPTNSQTKNDIMSNYWLINGAYFRLKNITLGYTIPKRITDKLQLQNVRVYASISDLFSLDHYPKGLDPETVFTGYWTTTTYLMGISLKF